MRSYFSYVCNDVIIYASDGTRIRSYTHQIVHASDCTRIRLTRIRLYKHQMVQYTHQIEYASNWPRIRSPNKHQIAKSCMKSLSIRWTSIRSPTHQISPASDRHLCIRSPLHQVTHASDLHASDWKHASDWHASDRLVPTKTTKSEPKVGKKKQIFINWK